MMRAAVAGLLVVAILASAVAGYLIGASNTRAVISVSTTTLLFYTVTSTLTNTNTMTSISTTTTTRTLSYSSSSPLAVMVTSHHLLLQASLVNSSIAQGNNITTHIRLTNVLAVTNDVPFSSSWAVDGLYFPGNPCSSTGGYEPLGIAIFKGYFTTGNISAGKLLPLDRPGPYYCPGITATQSWSFFPMNDVAWNNQVLYQLDANFTTNGSWQVGNQFEHFSLATYTLVVGDEWGDLLFLYFTVT
jgi:hypothetical protein